MCGIFGVVYGRDAHIQPAFAATVVETLFRCSEARGKEAAGLAVYDGRTINVLKQAGSVDEFLAHPKYREVMDGALGVWSRALSEGRESTLAITGHSRLVTNGAQTEGSNNQPVVARGSVVIHNGIIVNEADLWRRNPDLERRAEVDTEVLANLLRKHFNESGDMVWATRRTFSEIEGAASVACFLDDVRNLLLATNTGSLFFAANERKTFMVFASERFILQRLLAEARVEEHVGACKIEQLRAGNGMLIDLGNVSVRSFNSLGAPVADHAPSAPGAASESGARVEIVDHTTTAKSLRRCKQCILPETYPFMNFDAEGVCQYCRRWKTIAVKGEEALFKAVEPYRSKDGKPDVIVAFSGGRDSAYGLHYVKKTLGMNPVAFTYDWGMVTDLARRNQARLCGKLGVEHILRSADIPTKRRYVRKNVEAWLRKPEIGMVTLFTAGDKQFYKYARELRKETGIKLVIFCTGNMIEDTPYKTGLCGIDEKDHGMTLTGLHFSDEMKLLWYYFKNYLKNPGYWNESLWDTLDAYYQTFVVKDDFLYLFHYLKWEEETIVGTIRREYDWEVATDTTTTWRIGDGTAPFYNYIYMTMAGFSEDEVMLSNMIREGVMTREQALVKAAEFNKPRWPTLREYAALVGFNLEEAIQRINAAPKLY
jgi:glucosamine--fructose-6-phosphate aminotransferase (isomerizing)